MELVLQRDDANGRRTFGRFLLDGRRQCESIERALRLLRPTDAHPAIPAGRYPVRTRRSEHFSHAASLRVGHQVDVLLPHVDDVPGRTEIMIHPFNDPETESLGCIGPGTTRLSFTVTSSRAAFNALNALILAAEARGEVVTLAVRDPVFDDVT